MVITKISSSNKITASNINGFANVVTSGSYNDLSNKPLIPSEAVYIVDDISNDRLIFNRWSDTGGLMAPPSEW